MQIFEIELWIPFESAMLAAYDGENRSGLVEEKEPQLLCILFWKD